MTIKCLEIYQVARIGYLATDVSEQFFSWVLEKEHVQTLTRTNTCKHLPHHVITVKVETESNHGFHSRSKQHMHTPNSL